ncbi:hypothetical protein [Pedobacter insulae]|nr:hypothetical protein [Pedobacter insulae]
MMEKKKLKHQLIRTFLLLLVTISYFPASAINDYYRAEILFKKVAETAVINSLSNKEEVITWQKQYIGRRDDFLVRADTIVFLDSTYNRGIMGCTISGTNFYLVYYINCLTWKSTLLSYGYYGKREFVQTGWQKLIKAEGEYFGSISDSSIQHLFLDISIPSSFLIYHHGIKVNRIFERESINVYNNNLIGNDVFPYVLMNIFDNTFQYIRIKGSKNRFSIQILNDGKKHVRISEADQQVGIRIDFKP